MSEALSPAQRVAIARNPGRPNIPDFIHALFTDFLSSGATGSAVRTPES